MITFECRSGQWTLTRECLEVLCEAYPRKDVASELLKAKAWCYSNVANRKTPRGMMKFLNGWLSRSPDKPRGFIETHTDTRWASDIKR